MKRVGSVVLMAGAVLVIVSNFLRYFTDSSLTVWQVTTRYPVVLTVLAALAVAMAAVCFTGERVLPLGAAAVLGAFLVGEAFPVWTNSYHYRIGFWLAVGGAMLMVVGGLVALAGGIRAASEPALGFMPAAGGPTTTAVSGASTTAVSGAATTVVSDASTAWPMGAPQSQPVAGAAPAATTSTWAGRIATPRGETTSGPTATTNSTPTAVLPPAGWYPDPAGTARDRYWSGDQWTHDVRGD